MLYGRPHELCPPSRAEFDSVQAKGLMEKKLNMKINEKIKKCTIQTKQIIEKHTHILVDDQYFDKQKRVEFQNSW
jgi:hypothetical protein